MVKYVVRELTLPPCRSFALGMNLTIDNVDLLADLAQRSTRLLVDGGHNIARADFLFGEVFLIGHVLSLV